MVLVVSNASPLIALSSCGRLALLRELFGEVTIPEAVRREVVDQGDGRPLGSAATNRTAWRPAMPRQEPPVRAPGGPHPAAPPASLVTIEKQ
jgi:hypothetical protein